MPLTAPSIVDQVTPPKDAATPPPDKQPDVASDQLAKPVRPEWAGKSFDGYWTDDKGFDAEKLTTDFDAMTTLRTEHEARLAAVPENIEDYEVGLPEGFAIPDGVTLTFDKLNEDPIVKALLPEIRQFAKANNLDKNQFKGLVALKAKFDIAEHAALRDAAAKQKAALGTKAEARVGAVVTFLQGKLGNEHANALMPMMFNARQVEAFEKLVALAGGTTTPPGGGGRETVQPQAMTDAEWDKLSPTQKINYGRKAA